MNWQEVQVSTDRTHFLYQDKPIFDKKFLEVLKFHAPGFAPVKDESGAYHIDSNGDPLYSERYTRTFGFYCNRAAVVQGKDWFHINEKGERVYAQSFAWIGNFQENFCTVRDFENHYFHIDLFGNRIYAQNYRYAGDFKDGIACVKLENGLFTHIDAQGNFVHHKFFQDLGVFHKGFATAKDEKGWFHIDKQGNALYPERYLLLEPFYNGFALATAFNNEKFIIDEKGKQILKV